MPEAPETVVSEEEAAKEAVFNERGNRAVKALKFYAELILSLPDDVMPLDDKRLDELLEPRSQELFDKIRDAGLTMDECSIGFNQIQQIIIANSAKRIENFLKIVVQTINEKYFGYMEPIKEMPVGELTLLAQKTKETPETETTPE